MLSDPGGTLRETLYPRQAPSPATSTVIRSRFFWKQFFSHALVIIFTVAAVGFLVLHHYRADVVERMETALRHQCVALGDLVQSDVQSDRVAAVRDRIASVALFTGYRITIIGRDGTVIADSEADPDAMENHLLREEVEEALRREPDDTGAHFGQGLRKSRTLGTDHLYVAYAPRADDPQSLVMRVAVEMSSVDEDTAGVARLILAGGGVSTLLALLVGALMVHRVARPLDRMRKAAGALSAGDYSARVPVRTPLRAGDELGEMAQALNRLGFDMSQRVADLTAGQERLRAMVAGMVEGVVAVDESGRVTFSNHAARSLLGLGHEVSDRPIQEQTKVTGVGALLASARRSDRAAQSELEISNTNIDAIVSAQAHRFQDGDAVGVVMVLHDVSELRRLERIRRDFVANVSHELKTPLTSIRGYVETLLDGAIDDDENNVRFLEKIENNVLRLNHLVTDLLSLARIESQSGFLPVMSIDLHAAVEEAARRHETRAQARGQDLVIDTCAGRVKVLGDPEALTQIIDNLVDNAIKYTPDRGTVTVRLLRNGEFATLEVQDTGVGIPLGDQARVFERFYRVDKARSREVGGTGLGLSIVKHLVLALGGTIDLLSAGETGSTFRVRLRLAERD